MARKKIEDYGREKPTDPFPINKRYLGQQAKQLRVLRAAMEKQTGKTPTYNQVFDHLVEYGLSVVIERVRT